MPQDTAQQDIQVPKINEGREKIISSIIVVVLISIAIITGVVAYMSSLDQKSHEVINSLKNENQTLQAKIDELQRQASSTSLSGPGSYWSADCKMPNGVLSNGECLRAQLISPNDGADACIGSDIQISWSVPKEIEQIDLYLYADTDKRYDLGTFRATRNETGEIGTGKGTYMWKVGSDKNGTPIPPGETYKIAVYGLFPANGGSLNVPVMDQSDKLFSIVDCRG